MTDQTLQDEWDRQMSDMRSRDPVRATRLITRLQRETAYPWQPMSVADAVQIADDLRVTSCYFMNVVYGAVVAWVDSGMRTFEVSKHAAHELLLTRPPELDVLRPPVIACAVKFPAEGSCPVPHQDVAFVFVWNSDLLEGNKVAEAYADQDKASYLSPTAGVHYHAVSRTGNVCSPHPAIEALVGNLLVAITCRQDDLICETLQTRKTAALRPAIQRVRMRNPRIDLAPHVKRFVLEGERAFSSKRGHRVLGFFRRPPGGEQKTVWVRPHFRGGKLGAVTEPRVVEVVK